MSDTSTQLESQGQLNEEERRLLSETILNAEPKPKVVMEIGTWLGGGSTTHILRALEKNNAGHLWGIEADRSIYEQMVSNIRAAAPEAASRFTPLLGLSEQVIPKWLAQQEKRLSYRSRFPGWWKQSVRTNQGIRIDRALYPGGGIVVLTRCETQKRQMAGTLCFTPR